MKKTVIYAVVLVVVSLAAGIAVGVALEHRNVMEKRQHLFGELRERAGDRVKGVQQHRQQAVANLADKLNLTAEQKEKVKYILESSREEIAATRKDMVARVEAVRDSTNAKIQEVLTPEQQDRFKKLMSNFKQRHGKERRFKGVPAQPEPLD